MIRLLPSRCPEALTAYSRQPWRFPIIGAVLEGRQPGCLLVDNEVAPETFFVANRFGFAFAFAHHPDCLDSQRLVTALLAGAADLDRLRWYAPDAGLLAVLETLSGPEIATRSRRQQFTWPTDRSAPEIGVLPTGWNLGPLETTDLSTLDPFLDLRSRYWLGTDDLLAQSLGVRAKIDGQVAAVCYAAGIGGPGRMQAEIDIYTLEQFRGQGLGRLTGAAFIASCLARGILPHWDCYANNEPSLRLARSLGFVDGEEYDFCNLSPASVGGNPRRTP